MRTTVTLDADVRRILQDAMRQRGISFKQALNDAVRAGLLPAGARRKRRFVQKTYSLGAELLFPWDKALATADAIEDEEILPQAMKLLLFSDIHNDWKRLEDLLSTEADLYIADGDQCTWNKGIERYGQILERRGDKVYVLPGNHEAADKIVEMCALHGLHYFHDGHLQLGRWHIAGLGYSNPTPFNTPSEYSEAQLAEHLQPFAPLAPLVLVCHAPPYGTALDQVRPGLHAGSRSVLEFIEKHQPEYFFCGHIHEAEGASIEIGRTRARNVGKAGYLLELD